MRVLVAYASRHGATAGIAERVAATLGAAGVPAEAKPVDAVPSVEEYDAVVLGAAAYLGHWLKEAAAFAHRHQGALASRPVWLFSSGPLGTATVDAEGGDVADGARPKEFEELTAALHPRDTRVFFGAYDPAAPPRGLGERLTRMMPAAREALPAGDFRDWDAIDAWATGIAGELRRPEGGATG